MDLLDRYKGCLLGLAVGDAVGATLEFQPRGTFEPIDDMVGGGLFNLIPGQWTDDTSMALCLATSLIEYNGFDAVDQMQRYLKWRNEGYLSSTGKCFDIGNTVNSALDKYVSDGNPYAGSTDPYSAGNGCIMRLAPIPLYYYPNLELIEKYAAESSKTTHGTEECIDACRLFARIIYRALDRCNKEDILLADKDIFIGADKIENIARGDYLNKSISNIKGSGYVVESLEAALWCFNKTNNFKEAILCGANLGDDADTTAAICGQVAGAYYGVLEIPNKWLDKLSMLDRIAELAEQMYDEN